MNTSDFLDQLDDSQVLEAIRSAEAATSGEVRVFVSRNPAPDALATARLQFGRLGMERTPMRNAVLLYFAPRSQTYAIVGDEGIHRRVGQAFWDEIEAGIRARLKRGEITGAVVEAVGRVGNELGRHFPKNDGDRNDLPDEVIRD